MTFIRYEGGKIWGSSDMSGVGYVSSIMLVIKYSGEKIQWWSDMRAFIYRGDHN